MPSTRGRQDRERAFHDHAFNENVRRSAHAFYAVARAGSDRYRHGLANAVRSGAREVLEYGCGQGSDAFWLAEAGASVVGIDISPVAITQATERAAQLQVAERATFAQMDAERLRFEDASFDLVCGRGILHHLDLAGAGAELARVMKPDGIATFFEPLGHNPAINLYRALTPRMRTEDEHPLRLADLKGIERHFEEVRTSFFALTTLLALPLRRRPALAPALRSLERIDETLLRERSPLRRYAWIVVLELATPRPPRTPGR